MTAASPTENDARQGEKRSVTEGFASLAHDALELGELQLQLAKLDAIENARKLRSTVFFASIGAMTMLASLPVAMLALGEWFALKFDWTRPSALLASSVCGLLSAGLLVGLAYFRLRQGFATWSRSSEELRRNVNWLKQSLKPSDQLKPSSSMPNKGSVAQPNFPPR